MKKKLAFILLLLLAVLLRTYNLLSLPPSLYWEEVALGYDAYSVFKTGADHHGNPLPIIAFESFGDWKPSLYFYYLIPFIATFGLTQLAVRIAAVVVGLSVVVGVYLLARRVEVPSLVALFVAAVSPWSIIFSRAAWEAHLATSLLLFGVICLLFAKTSQKKIIFYILSGILFGLSMYAYHATRVVAPLVAAIFVLVEQYSLIKSFRKKLFSKLIRALLPLVTMVIVAAPLLLAVATQNEAVTHRFSSTTIFSDLSIIEESNYYKSLADNSLLARIFYHRYLLFAREIVSNFLSYFTISFLALTGDVNPRHSTGYGGIIYPLELLFLLIGIYSWIKNSSARKIGMLFWLVLAIVPATVTTVNPHALRILPALPVVLLLVAEGLFSTFRFSLNLMRSIFQYSLFITKKHLPTILVIIFFTLYGMQFAIFWRHYTQIYSATYSGEWQYGYQQMIAALPENEQIYISRYQGRPAIFYWFFKQVAPQRVQAAENAAVKDQSEFLEFENVLFYDRLDQIVFTETAVVAADPDQLEQLMRLANENNYSYEEIKRIKQLDGSLVWVIGRISPQ